MPEKQTNFFIESQKLSTRNLLDIVEYENGHLKTPIDTMQKIHSKSKFNEYLQLDFELTEIGENF